jgi:hypothetical protein
MHSFQKAKKSTDQRLVYGLCFLRNIAIDEKQSPDLHLLTELTALSKTPPKISISVCVF